MHLNRGRNRTQEFDLSDTPKRMFRSGRRARSRELVSDGNSLFSGKRRKLLRRLPRAKRFRSGETRCDSLYRARRKGLG